MGDGRRWGVLLGWGVAALVVLQWASPVPVAACGGLFCSNTPVDQTAERIIFAVNDDGTVTAHVQIRYAGDRDNFAWIIPVAETPELGVFPQLAMMMLDRFTAPQYPNNQCSSHLAASALGPSGGVEVFGATQVGPFDTVTVGGEYAAQLVAWLQDNDYRVTDAMIPYIQQYVDEGMRFLAMKLLPDADVSDIQPISMTYRGVPAVPIRLTAVAAQPEMNILVWIFADRRYAPKNYADVVIPDDQVHAYQFSNYPVVLSREVDKVGGHGFVTEYAQDSAELLDLFGRVPYEEASTALLALGRGRRFVTRLRTRMSAEEMTVDPVFEAVPDGQPVGTDRQTPAHVVLCQLPPSCSFDYCGRAGACVALERPSGTFYGVPADACHCAVDSTARLTTTGPLNIPRPYCEPLAQDVSEPRAPGQPDLVCAGITCGGGGRCIALNGSPSCRCEPGRVAIADAQVPGGLACVEAAGPFPEPPVLPPVPQGRFVQTSDPSVAQPMGAGDDDNPGGQGTPRPTEGDAGVSVVMRPPSAGSPGSEAPEVSRVPEGSKPKGSGLSCRVGVLGTATPRGSVMLGLAAVGLAWRRRRFANARALGALGSVGFRLR